MSDDLRQEQDEPSTDAAVAPADTSGPDSDAPRRTNGSPGGRLRNGLTLRERRRERRDALLDAALELFGTKGYASTSVEEICRSAFVSTRNFYEEFDNRDAVLQALGDQLAGRAYEAVVGVAVGTGPDRLPRESRARVTALVHTLVDDPRQARIAFIESRGVSQQQEERRRVAHRMFAYYLANLVTPTELKGSFDRRKVETFSLALVGAINELIADWVLREDQPPVDDLIDSIVEVIVVMGNALRPDRRGQLTDAAP